jgi:hypothetical protein
VLYVPLAVAVLYLVARAFYQIGKEDGEESGFENGYKFARYRALQYTHTEGYENGQAS